MALRSMDSFLALAHSRHLTRGGSGIPEVDVAFDTKSSSGSDYKTVIAECGNSVTVNVVVHELEITEPETRGTYDDEDEYDSWIGSPSYRLDWQAVAGNHGNTDITLTVAAEPERDFGEDLAWVPVYSGVGTLSPATGMSTTLSPHASGSAWIASRQGSSDRSVTR